MQKKIYLGLVTFVRVSIGHTSHEETVAITNIRKINFRRSDAHCGLKEREVGRSHDLSPGILGCKSLPALKYRWVLNITRVCYLHFTSIKDTAKRVSRNKTNM